MTAGRSSAFAKCATVRDAPGNDRLAIRVIAIDITAARVAAVIHVIAAPRVICP
jgi:hypothetical protein